jgi:hypothetical protein
MAPSSALSARDVEVLAAAFQSLKTPPEVRQSTFVPDSILGSLFPDQFRCSTRSPLFHCPTYTSSLLFSKTVSKQTSNHSHFEKQIDYEKLAEKANYKNASSARACFQEVKKKLRIAAGNDTGESDCGCCFLTSHLPSLPTHSAPIPPSSSSLTSRSGPHHQQESSQPQKTQTTLFTPWFIPRHARQFLSPAQLRR